MLTPPRAVHASPVTPLNPPALPFALQPTPGPQQAQVPVPTTMLNPASCPSVRTGLDIRLGASLNAACFWSVVKSACWRKPSELVTPCLGPTLGSVWGSIWPEMECLP